MAKKTTTKTTKKTVKKVKVDPMAYEKIDKSSIKAPTYKAPKDKAPEYTVEQWNENFQSGKYNSKYMPKIEETLDKVTNWKYDPLQDASYQALAKVYGARGNIAAKNSLADAAALNGGYGTSYAVSAAQQARNQYNQELASMVPELEQTAYQRTQGNLNALMDMDNTMYGRFRDTEGDRWNQYLQRYDQFRDYQGDRQFKYSADYDKYRDIVGDSQWLYDTKYKKYQDAMSQYQWAKNYNMDLYQLEQQQTSSSSSSGGGGGGGGGGRSYGGGGGYSSKSSASADGSKPPIPFPTEGTSSPNSVVYYQSNGSVNNQSNNSQYMNHSRTYNRNILKKK